MGSTLFSQSHKHCATLSPIKQKFFNALSGDDNLRVNHESAINVQVHHILIALASLCSQFTHFIEFENEDSWLTLSLHTVNNFLEAWVVRF